MTLALMALLLPHVAHAGSAKASSEYVDSDRTRHGAALAVDGLMSTGWAEGEPGLPEAGEAWLELNLDRETDVKSVSIWPGNLTQGDKSYREYSRPKVLTVVLDDGSEEPPQKQVRLLDEVQRLDVEVEGTTKKVKILIDEAYEGFVFTDLFISEVAVNFSAGDTPGALDKLVEWQKSSAGQKAMEKSREEVIALFDRIDAAEFGDRDALAEIVDRAADGAPYLRSRVTSLVPVGYRVQALPPEEVAIEALLKLKDANGISGLQAAAFRTTGRTSVKYQRQVEYFYAYQDLIGGGSRNVPYWGQTGWEEGALRSFDEPLDVQVDSFGSVYVADTGNHRVQRYTIEGRPDRVWGKEPGITDKWFDDRRTFYVAGSEPSTDAGAFIHPVAIAIIPGKDGDGFAVLDAVGRIQVFDLDGNLQISWEIISQWNIQPGVGGEGYLMFAKNKLIAIWQNEAIVYSLDAEELARWEIEDGTPNGAVALKNGKLALIFGPELVMYSADGFRHGSLLGDELGDGFENWDVAVDDRGKLWAVTDTGTLIKYKKPGKVDFELDVAKDYSLKAIRLAVFDDMVFITDRDKVMAIDALELKAEKEAEEARAAEEAAAAAE